MTGAGRRGSIYMRMEVVMSRERSSKYLFTVDHSTDAGAHQIELVRSVVKSANAQAREVGSDVHLRVTLSPRKGVDNRHAWKYSCKNARRTMRFEDYERVDVYLTRSEG